MKLATYLDSSGRARIAAVQPEADLLIDLSAAAQARGKTIPAFDSMLALMQSGAAGLESAREIDAAPPTGSTLPLARTRLCAPLPIPEQIRDFSVAPQHLLHSPRGFRRLARAAGAPLSEEQVESVAPIPEVFISQPLYYKGNRFTCVGTDADITWPRFSKVIDFEAEIAAYIGAPGVDIGVDKADRHIFGYSIFNDFSARDAQMMEMQGPLGPAKGKDFATGNAFGPWIVTADEIPDPYALRIEVRVNGERWTAGTLGTAYHRFVDMLAFVSRDEPLYPGEIFGSGTMDNGCGLELGRYLDYGDLVEIEVEQLGTLRNRIGQPNAL